VHAALSSRSMLHLSREGCEWILKRILLVALLVLSAVAGFGHAYAMPLFTDTSKQAVFLSPLEDWMPTWNLEDYVSPLEQAGYHVDVLLGENVTVSFLKTGLANYDLIILRTDSFPHEGFSFFCSGEPVKSDSRKTFENEISSREVFVGICVGFSLIFLLHYYPPGALRHGLVYVLASHSTELATGFLSGGVAVFVGYDDDHSLYWGMMDAFSQRLIRNLSNGYSTKEAVLQLYQYLNLGHGATADWPTIHYYGDGTYKI